MVHDLNGMSVDLALGMRESSIDLKVKLKQKDGEEKVTIKFPA